MGVSKAQLERWERIASRYASGEQMASIAAAEGVDRKTVYNVARRFGLPNRHVFDEARNARIVCAYRRGDPIRSICEAENVHRAVVRRIAERAGCAPRSEAGRKYPVDHYAFDEPDATGWWLIGLLAADGSVSSRSNLISLCQNEDDSDVLEAFLDFVGSSGRPLTELKLSEEAATRTWPRRRALEARVFSGHMREALGRHGIVPRKSRTMELSPAAAAEPAVWLGVLDGDGWVATHGQRGRPRIDFFGSPQLMSQCSAFWGERLTFQRGRCPKVQDHAGGLARVVLHGANAVRGARLLLDSSAVSLRRKRRILEDIAALEDGQSESAPVVMRSSDNSNNEEKKRNGCN